MSCYICKQRARFKSLTKRADGSFERVNIPYGTAIEERGSFLFHGDKMLCRDSSQIAIDFFSLNDDGKGLERGELTKRITKRLEPEFLPSVKSKKVLSPEYQARWDKIWADDVSQKYRKDGDPDFWFWGLAFYRAPIEDLQHIAKLIGG